MYSTPSVDKDTLDVSTNQASESEFPSENNYLANMEPVHNQPDINIQGRLFFGDTTYAIQCRTEKNWNEIISISRRRDLVVIRASIVYFLRQHVRDAWRDAEIAELLHRDRTTVMHSERVANQIKEYPWTDQSGLYGTVINAMARSWPEGDLK